MSTTVVRTVLGAAMRCRMSPPERPKNQAVWWCTPIEVVTDRQTSYPLHRGDIQRMCGAGKKYLLPNLTSLAREQPSANMLCVFAQSLAHTVPEHRAALPEPITPPLDSIDPRATSLHVHGLKKGADDVPMVIIGSSGDCTSLSESPGDEWCTATCKDNMDTNPTCPTLCDCDAQSNEERVDYDPIQAGEQEGDEAVDAAAAAVAAAAAAARRVRSSLTSLIK